MWIVDCSLVLCSIVQRIQWQRWASRSMFNLDNNYIHWTKQRIFSALLSYCVLFRRLWYRTMTGAIGILLRIVALEKLLSSFCLFIILIVHTDSDVFVFLFGSKWCMKEMKKFNGKTRMKQKQKWKRMLKRKTLEVKGICWKLEAPFNHKQTHPLKCEFFFVHDQG